jgi:hypothetical protein
MMSNPVLVSTHQLSSCYIMHIMPASTAQAASTASKFQQDNYQVPVLPVSDNVHYTLLLFQVVRAQGKCKGCTLMLVVPPDVSRHQTPITRHYVRHSSAHSRL